MRPMGTTKALILAGAIGKRGSELIIAFDSFLPRNLPAQKARSLGHDGGHVDTEKKGNTTEQKRYCGFAEAAGRERDRGGNREKRL